MACPVPFPPHGRQASWRLSLAVSSRTLSTNPHLLSTPLHPWLVPASSASCTVSEQRWGEPPPGPAELLSHRTAHMPTPDAFAQSSDSHSSESWSLGQETHADDSSCTLSSTSLSQSNGCILMMSTFLLHCKP